MKNILVTGSYGQLGSDISSLSKKYPELNFFFTDVDTLDISKKEDILSFCTKNNINYLINCAAYTAVDKAEEETELNNLINASAPLYLSEVSKTLNIKLIHISTDYVFDGNNFKPYVETDKTNPNSVYGKAKLKGEENSLKNPQTIIIRTSWLYSSYGKNFVKTMLNLSKTRDEISVVFDQIGTPTYSADLAQTIIAIINNNFIPGIYNFSNEGVASWYDFAKQIFEYSDISCKVYPIESKDFPTPAKRPFYSVLNKTKIKDTFNIEIPNWTDSLKVCLSKISNS